MNHKAFFVLLFLWQMSYGIDQYQLSASEHARFNQLASGFRCMVCQHQNVYESYSPWAMQLKEDIYQSIITGQTDEQITYRMVQKFGQEILWQPTFNLKTFFLWGAPVIFLLLGAVGFVLFYRRSNQ